ncbi:MAG: hypothetical protein ACEY3J_04625 [Arsenophonus sp.]
MNGIKKPEKVKFTYANKRVPEQKYIKDILSINRPLFIDAKIGKQLMKFFAERMHKIEKKVTKPNLKLRSLKLVSYVKNTY